MPPPPARTPRVASRRPTRSEHLLTYAQHPDEPVPATGSGLVRVDAPSRTGPRPPSTPRPDQVRLRLDIASDGTALHGWAPQPRRRTVQGELEAALATVLRVPVALTVAGRTDAGVHATGQVASLQIPRTLWEQHRDKLVRRLRGVLAADLAVPAATEAHPDFDARFGALARRYVYRLTDAPGGPSPLRRADTVAWPRTLDSRAMTTAAASLLG